MSEEMDKVEFHPELLPRRGEYMAWGTALLALIGLLIAQLSGRPVISVIKFLVVFFFLTAASISLGNWMDRKTTLRVSERGVHFKNGLRNVELKWPEIKSIQVFLSSWGKKVRVWGENGHFDFRTLGEFKLGNESKGRMGFSDGEAILNLVLERSGLVEIEHKDNSYLYARL